MMTTSVARRTAEIVEVTHEPGNGTRYRAIAVTPTSNPAFGTSVGTYGAPRVTAISIVAIPFDDDDEGIAHLELMPRHLPADARRARAEVGHRVRSIR